MLYTTLPDQANSIEYTFSLVSHRLNDLGVSVSDIILALGLYIFYQNNVT
jgi:hypothetical protein